MYGIISQVKGLGCMQGDLGGRSGDGSSAFSQKIGQQSRVFAWKRCEYSETETLKPMQGIIAAERAEARHVKSIKMADLRLTVRFRAWIFSLRSGITTHTAGVGIL
jgi:hypothetical protein